MAGFKLRRLDAVGRLKAGEYSSELEKEALIRKALGPKGTTDPNELFDLLQIRDVKVRKATLMRIYEVAGLDFVDVFLERAAALPQDNVRAMSRVLVKVLPEGYHERLAPTLSHQDPAMRMAAEELFAASHLSPALIANLDVWLATDSNIAVRLMTRIQEAVQQGDQPLEVWMIVVERAVDHPDPEVRRVGYLTLADPNDATYISQMLEAVARETPTNQRALWQILDRLAKSRTVTLTDQLIPMLADERTTVRSATVSMVKRLPDLTEVIQGFVRHSRTLSEWSREAAFDSLAALGSRMMEPLLDLMNEGDRELRLQAISLAARHGSEQRLIKPLLETLDDEEDWWITSRVIVTLGRLAQPSTFSRLASLLKKRDLALVAADALATAARRLMERGQPQDADKALTPLFNLLRTNNSSTSSQAHDLATLRLEIIEVLSGVPYAEVLRMLLNTCRRDSNPEVALRAMEVSVEMAESLGETIPDILELKEGLMISTLSKTVLTPLEEMLMEARERQASELTIAVNKPPLMRRRGELIAMETQPVLSAHRSAELIRALLDDSQAEKVALQGALNYCHEVRGLGRYRASVFVDHRGVNAVFRIIPTALPELEEVNLPHQFAGVAYRRQGLVLVSSSQAQGRTTSLAALVHHINSNRRAHIVSLDSPIEFIHAHRQSVVSQRQIDLHSTTMVRALAEAVRQDPDVIAVDELRTPEELMMAVRAANSGHLVIAALRVPRVGAEATIRHLLEGLPGQTRRQTLLDLASCLQALSSQTLIPRADGVGQIAVHEVLLATMEVQAAIREDRLEDLEELIVSSHDVGMVTLDEALMKMLRSGTITPMAAYPRARHKSTFEPLLRRQE